MEVRIQKHIADCGLVSRRAAEREIELGHVTVNGEKAVIGQKIDPKYDVVKVGGRIASTKEQRKVYVMLYKPRGYVTTMSDEMDRKCIPELISDVGQRIYPCGRLDMESEGLLILTNDGVVADKLMHPKNHLAKVYHVKVKTEISPEKLLILNSPMKIDGYDIAPVKVEIISRKEGTTSLRFTLHEGRNRQIRKMCEQAELEIIRLKRVSVGELNIGMLKPGKWKYLNYSEVQYLKNL
jgi:23S rRNA pseudouridine2605 synthase